VLRSDAIWGEATRLADIPAALIERLRHYFLTYKLVPGEPNRVTIDQVYDTDHAQRVVEAAISDYAAEFGASVSESR
jgi:inorganic pyrophosphatase